MAKMLVPGYYRPHWLDSYYCTSSHSTVVRVLVGDMDMLNTGQEGPPAPGPRRSIQVPGKLLLYYG